MEYKLINDKYIIRIDKGDRIIESLMDFCSKNRIIMGYFFGIGAVSNIEFAHYNLATKEYSDKTIEEPLEICHLFGNIALLDGRIALHSHIIVGNSQMQTFGGHLKEATVAATCEIILHRINSEINRKHSEEIGLNLLDI